MGRVVAILITAALLLTIVALGVRAWRLREARQITLATGQRVELLGVRKAGDSFTTEKPWETYARKHLPRHWLTWLPQPVSGSCGGGDQSITVYLRVTDSNGITVTSTPWNGYQAESDDGFSFNREGGYCSFGGGVGGKVIYGLILRAHPRRQPDFALCFTDSRETNIGRLRVPNPIHDSFPEWHAEPLPASKTNGPVVLTLESFSLAGHQPWRRVQAEWKLSTLDPAWAHAEAGYVSVSDATGNEGSCLSPQEPVWKLSTLVHRQRDEDFRSDERFALTNLALPGLGEVSDLEYTGICAGVTIRIRALAGAGTLYFTNNVRGAMVAPALGSSGHGSSHDGLTRVESWGSERPFLLIETQGGSRDDALRVRLTDPSDREIKLHDRGNEYGADGKRTYKREFDPSADTEFLNLSVIVSRPLAFEFLVNPVDAKPQAANDQVGSP